MARLFAGGPDEAFCGAAEPSRETRTNQIAINCRKRVDSGCRRDWHLATFEE